MAGLREKVIQHLQTTHPEYQSSRMIANATDYARSTVHTQLSLMHKEGEVQKKSGAAPGPKQLPANPTDPMPHLRMDKVIGWRLKK